MKRHGLGGNKSDSSGNAGNSNPNNSGNVNPNTTGTNINNVGGSKVLWWKEKRIVIACFATAGFIAISVGIYLLINNDKGGEPTPNPTISPSLTPSPNPSGKVDPKDPSKSTTGDDRNVVSVTSIDTSLPNPKVLAMDGSVTMVRLIKVLRNGYAQVNANLPTTYGGLDSNGNPQDGDVVQPSGSAKGLKNLIDNKVMMVATSRTLKPDEAKAGIQAIQIARDAVAIVVGKENSFQGSLSKAQLRDIYAGKITNWSEVGGSNLPIKVYNRHPDSGTQGFFKDDVMLDTKFASDGENFKTWERDETTAVLKVLGNNGIYYTTVTQAEKQPTIRVVLIDGISPENRKAITDRTYPIVRFVYLAVPKQSSPAVKQFVEFALSDEGQRLVEQAEFIRLK